MVTLYPARRMGLLDVAVWICTFVGTCAVFAASGSEFATEVILSVPANFAPLSSSVTVWANDDLLVIRSQWPPLFAR